MTPLQHFRRLVADAAQALKPDSSTAEIIPFGAELVELVRAHPNKQEEFEWEFISSIGVAPPELVEFCMHALRWKSLKEYFGQKQTEAITRNDWRAEPYFRHLLASFDDDWEDAKVFYAEYFSKSI